MTCDQTYRKIYVECNDSRVEQEKVKGGQGVLNT